MSAKIRSSAMFFYIMWPVTSKTTVKGVALEIKAMLRGMRRGNFSFMWSFVHYYTCQLKCGGLEEPFCSKQFGQLDLMHVQLNRVHCLSFKTGRRTRKAKSSLYIPPSLTFKNSHSPSTVYLWVLCGSQNKQWLFPYTALTDWFVYCAVRTEYIKFRLILVINPAAGR